MSLSNNYGVWVLQADEFGKSRVDAVWGTRLKNITHKRGPTAHKDQISTHLCLNWHVDPLDGVPKWLTFSRHPAKTVLQW